MKKWLALLLAPLALVLTGCDNTNGWSAQPLDGTEETCYQVTRWESNGWGETKYWAEGVYCPAEVTSQEKDTY